MTSRRPARVLLVQPSPVRGGAEESLLELVARADPGRVTFTVACLADGPVVDDLEAAGARVVRLRAQRLRYVWMWALTVWRLAKLAKQHDVVLSWQVKGNYYGTPAAKLTRKPVAWWDHGIRPAKGEPRYWIDNVLPSLTAADLVLASSAASASRHRRSKAILPGIPLEPFERTDRRDARRALGVTDEQLVLGIVGRLQPWKGQLLLIDALPAIRRRFANAIVVIVGGIVGGMSEGFDLQLHATAQRLGVADAVRFLGQRDDVASLLPGFDRFIQASYGEPFGLVTVEAMAAGVPVIATAAGGTLEIVSDGVDGLLTPVGDAAALADTIIASLSDPAEAKRLAVAGRLKARRDFDIARYVREIEDTMIELAGRRP